MWIRAGRHRLLSVDPARLDSVELKSITHSESFGLVLRGREEQLVMLGEDLEAATAVFEEVCIALAAGRAYLDLSNRP
jgi:hypothetical protein